MLCPADLPSADAGASGGTGGPMDGGMAPSQCPPEQLVEVQECSFICADQDPCILDPKLCGPDMPVGCEPTQNCQYVWECPPPPPSDAGSCPMVEHCDTPPPCDGGGHCEPPKCMMVPSCEPPPACAPEDMVEIQHCNVGRVCDDPCLSIPVAPECAGGPNPCEPSKVEECQPLYGMCQEMPNTAECKACQQTFAMCLK